MKELLVWIFALTLGMSVAFAGEVSTPDINVGTNWAFKKINVDTGVVGATWKNVVQEKTSSGYDIVRYDGLGTVLRRYSLSRNLGDVTNYGGSKIGDGNQYKFPLRDGETWMTREYWRSDGGYDEVTYTVVQSGLTIKVDAGQFSVVKVTGVGTWRNPARNWQGTLNIVTYYSPDAQVAVRTERTNGHSVNGQIVQLREIYELTSFEIK